MKYSKLVLVLGVLALSPAAFAGKCTVTEFVNIPTDAAGRILYIAPLGPNTPSQEVTYAASTKITDALKSSTNFVRVYCDSEARVAIGTTSITAVAGSAGLPAGGWDYFQVSRGGSPVGTDFYVAIYDGTT